MKFIKERCILISVTTDIVKMAINVSFEKNIPSINSLIYASSILNKTILLTLDNDFRNLDNVMILS